MIRFFPIVLLLFSFTLIYSQTESEFTPLQNFSPNINNSLQRHPSNSLSLNNNIRSSISMGTSFMNFSGYNFLTSYVAPQVTYDFDERFRITAGTMVMHTNYGSTYRFDNNSKTYAQRLAQYYMFAKGEYQLSENINIRAATFFELGEEINRSRTSLHNIGFDFKITDNAFIHADFSFGNYNPYNLYNPFFGDRTPFGRNHFGYSPFYY